MTAESGNHRAFKVQISTHASRSVRVGENRRQQPGRHKQHPPTARTHHNAFHTDREQETVQSRGKVHDNARFIDLARAPPDETHNPRAPTSSNAPGTSTRTSVVKSGLAKLRHECVTRQATPRSSESLEVVDVRVGLLKHTHARSHNNQHYRPPTGRGRSDQRWHRRPLHAASLTSGAGDEEGHQRASETIRRHREPYR